MPYTFEPLGPAHRDPVIQIFNYFVSYTFSAYPDKPVDKTFFDKLLEMSRGYPAYAVRHESGKIVGFGMLRPWHSAATFRRTAEICYFLLPEHTRTGVGTKLLAMLVDGAKRMGIDSILGSISSRNEESINFHAKNGFTICGRFTNVGKKFDRDFDVVWVQKTLS